jgi:hypothetical protein
MFYESETEPLSSTSQQSYASGSSRPESFAQEPSNIDPVLAKKIENISGRQVTGRLGDTSFITTDPKDGTNVITYIRDTSQESLDLEEVTTLSREEETQIKRESLGNAARAIINHLGASIDRKRLERYFPGLDIDDIDSYDFALSTIHILAVGDEDLEAFGDSSFNAATFPIRKGSSIIRGLEETRIETIDLNPNPPLLINTDKVDLMSANADKQFTRDQTMTHELLHILGFAENVSHPVNEAIIEFYANRAMQMEFPERVPDDYDISSYSDGVEAVAIIHKKLAKQGLTDAEIQSAFTLSNEIDVQKANTLLVTDKINLDVILREDIGSMQDFRLYVLKTEGDKIAELRTEILQRIKKVKQFIDRNIEKLRRAVKTENIQSLKRRAQQRVQSTIKESR